MARYAIIEQDGTVQNVCEWDGVTQWEPPEATVVLLLNANDGAETGGHYDGQTFTPAPRSEPEPENEELSEQLGAIALALKSVPGVTDALQAAGINVKVDADGKPTGVEITDKAVVDVPVDVPVDAPGLEGEV